jgi:DNA polymerase-3 subunit delta
MILGYNEIIKQLEQKIYQPVYMLMGDEPYFIDKVSNYIGENVLNESEKTFNQTILYGKDTTADIILTAAGRFPMMSSHQVVIVREAQHLRNLEKDLLNYVEKPSLSTILVLCYKYKSIDKRTSFYKTLNKSAVVFESKKIYENMLMPWIEDYCKQRDYKIDRKASNLISEYLGTSISKVVNELEKLMLVLPPKSTITADDIEKNIGISKDNNIYELNNALGKREIEKANRIIKYFGDNPKINPFQVVIAALYKYFATMLRYHLTSDKSENNARRIFGTNFISQRIQHARNYTPKKIVDIISLIREYDLKAKGLGNVTTPVSDLYRELIFKILH